MNKFSPEHLSKLTITVKANELPFDHSWLSQLSFKARLIRLDNEWFQIRYSGIRYDDALLGTNGEVPLVIYGYTQTADTDQPVLIFDERVHGYESIMVEKKYFANPDFKDFFDLHGAKEFRIYFCANSGIDFGDEYPVNPEGELLTLDGTYRSLDWLRANAFDYVAIFLENKEGHFTKLLELELA